MPFCPPYRIFLYTSGAISCLENLDCRIIGSLLQISRKDWFWVWGFPCYQLKPNVKDPPPCYFNLINPASWYLDARKSYAQGWTYVLFKSSWVLLRSFQKNEMFSRSFAFFIKRTKHSLRSLKFFIKECGVLCVLLRSL